LLHFVVF